MASEDIDHSAVLEVVFAEDTILLQLAYSAQRFDAENMHRARPRGLQELAPPGAVPWALRAAPRARNGEQTCGQIDAAHGM